MTSTRLKSSLPERSQRLKPSSTPRKVRRVRKLESGISRELTKKPSTRNWHSRLMKKSQLKTFCQKRSQRKRVTWQRKKFNILLKTWPLRCKKLSRRITLTTLRGFLHWRNTSWSRRCHDSLDEVQFRQSFSKMEAVGCLVNGLKLFLMALIPMSQLFKKS